MHLHFHLIGGVEMGEKLIWVKNFMNCILQV
jgi:diadenosine tetraphosphate (Ap4A) HIT family hydrolase